MPSTELLKKIDPNAFLLTPQALKRHTNPNHLPDSTQQVAAYDFSFGQERAVKAIDTALDIRAKGYHVFAVGENGLGKRTIIKKLLSERAKLERTPDDLMYVHNFSSPRCPIAITLPTGVGKTLARDMDKLWQNARKKLTQKFTSLSYQNQLGAIKHTQESEEKKLINDFNALVKPHNLTLAAASVSTLRTGSEGAEPLMNVFGVLDPSLPVDEASLKKLQKKLIALNHTLDELENQSNTAIDTLNETLADKVLEPIFKPLLKKYEKELKNNPKLHAYLSEAKDDMIGHAIDIVQGDDAFLGGFGGTPARYAINVLVSHSPDSGAPIVFEELPTHLNLLGHIEYVTELGTAYSDVSMIRAGALHKANGGYLLLEAQSLLEHPYAWQGLKRALQSDQIKISSLEQMLTLTGSLSLEPLSVDLSVKVILLGEPDLYYELLEFEPEFNAVFKIRADFHDSIKRDETSELALVAKMADMVADLGLLPFDKTACAAILDELSVMSESSTRLDLHSDRLSQLLLESHRCATYRQKKPTHVTKDDVKTALAAMHDRKGYLRELYWQELKNGQQLISTKGTAVGQINALTVISYADSEFGMPARLTALIAPKFGNGEILDIERDVELGGSLHAKGMLIMASFLRALFSEFHELNFSASLAFEQSYGHIDGDSATLAEACALLSALADVPISQSLAITGSMNQLGEAQAIGGLNAKIAGFFDACQETGLDGSQGVIIPRTNLNELMLRDDIVTAVADGKFHIYAVSSIYEALALLSGLSINEKNKKGDYKKHTLFYKIIKRLASWEQKEEEEDKNAQKK